MRLNHLLHGKADRYIDMTPVVIPIQGAAAREYLARSEQFCVHGGNHPQNGIGEPGGSHRRLSARVLALMVMFGPHQH